jgi:putative endonuclease
VSRRRVRLGESGETIACEAIEREGYTIRERRYRSRAGEIDIIAMDAGTVAFIEVKTRQGATFGAPADAVTPLKQLHIRLVAEDYLARHRLHDVPCRFDVVCVTTDAQGRWQAEIIKGAFDAIG